jgi:hypothetical protein
MEEPDIDVLGEHVDIAKGCIRHASRRVAVMQKFGDVRAAVAHLRKPFPRNDRELRASGFEPTINLRLVPYGAIESEKTGHE